MTYLNITIDFIVLAFIYLLVLRRKWKATGRDRLVVNTLMYIYLALVLYFTLMPVTTSLPFIFDHPYVPMNMTPFIDVSYERGDFVRQIVLNIIMMAPFGFLFPLVNPKQPTFPRTVLFAFLLSLGIELIQPLISSSRSSDVTDLITNVSGSILGYTLYLIFRPLTAKVLNLLKDKPLPPEKEPSEFP